MLDIQPANKRIIKELLYAAKSTEYNKFNTGIPRNQPHTRINTAKTNKIDKIDNTRLKNRFISSCHATAIEVNWGTNTNIQNNVATEEGIEIIL